MSTSHGSQIRQTRVHVRMTQQELADRMTEHGYPLDNAAISRIENGHREVSLGMAIALHQIIGFTWGSVELGDPDMFEMGRRDGIEAAMYAVKELLG